MPLKSLSPSSRIALSRAWIIAHWLIVTAGIALALPWILLLAVPLFFTILAAIAAPQHAVFAAIRETSTILAASSDLAWIEFEVRFGAFAWICAAITLAWRCVWNPWTLDVAARAGRHMDAWTLRQFPRLPVAGSHILAAGLLSIVLVALIAFQSAPPWPHRPPSGTPEVSASATHRPAAALLPEAGTIVSGDASVVRQADGSYLVRFR